MKLQIDYSDIGWVKTIGYIATGAYVWIDSIGVNAYVFTVLFFFMGLDMLSGWWKASKVEDLENPTSKKAKKGILTKLIIFVLPAVAGLIWGAFDKESAFKIVNLLLTALMVAEGYSVIGNAYTIYTGEVLSEFDAITFVFKKTAQKIKLLLEKLMK